MSLEINEKFVDTLGKHDYQLACAIETYQLDKANLYDTYYGVKEYLEKGQLVVVLPITLFFIS